LGVIAASFEQLIAIEEGGFEFGGVLDGVTQDRCSEGVVAVVDGVDEDESVIGKDRREQLAEGLGKGCVGIVGGFEGVEDGAGAEQFGCLIEERTNAWTKPEVADGLVAVRLGHAQLVYLMARGEGDVVGFFEVVVLGRKPEDGNGAGVFGFANCRCGLEEGKEGSAKERDLLASDDGRGSLAKAGNVS